MESMAKLLKENRKIIILVSSVDCKHSSKNHQGKFNIFQRLSFRLWENYIRETLNVHLRNLNINNRPF